MRYRKQKEQHNPQYIYWHQGRIVKAALAKGWKVFVMKLGRRYLVKQQEKRKCEAKEKTTTTEDLERGA